ncbi:MAG: NUDIX domain-containing protein [Pseudomonadota bacterium]
MSGFRAFGDTRDVGPRRGALSLIADGRGRLLLQLRDADPTVTHPGLWGLFGGGVEPGESLKAAAIRELDEELGIAPAPTALQPFGWVASDSARKAALYVFAAHWNLAPAQIRLGEGAGFGFFTPDQARTLPFVAVLKPVLDAYIAEHLT